MAQAPQVRQPQRLPLVSNIEARDAFVNLATDIQKDAQLINCYAEYDPKTQEFIIHRRPGYSTAITVPGVTPGPGLGIFAFTPDVASGLPGDYILAVIGSKCYAIGIFNVSALSATVTDLGTVNTSGGFYRFVVVPRTPPLANQIVLGNGVKAYYTDASLTPVTEILTTDDFPSTFFKGWAYINSRLYVASPNNVLQGATNLSDPAIWDPLNVILAQDEPDFGIALAKHLTFAVYFKEWTTEIFFNDPANLVGSTLSVASQNKLDIGLINSDSVREIDGALFFVASSKERMLRVARIDDLKYTIVSTPVIEKILEQFSRQINTYVFKICGHRFFIINCTSADASALSLVYDIDQQLWYRWEGPNTFGTTIKTWPIISATVTGFGTANKLLNIVQEGDGSLHFAAPDYVTSTDAGDRFAVDIYTSNYDAGIDRIKQLNMMYFNTDFVVGSVLQMRTNDFDFAVDKWTNFVDIKLDELKPQLSRQGSFYRRAFHFRHFLPCPFRMKSVALQMDIGEL